MRTTSREAGRNLVETGHAEFDRKVDYLGTGNVISPCLVGNYVRPVSQTWCNGMQFKPGALRSSDLGCFGRLPPGVEAALAQADEQVILYKVMHPTGPSHNRSEVVHGWILTRGDHNQHEIIGSWVVGPTGKSERVVDTVKEYLANPPGTAMRVETELAPQRAAGMAGKLGKLPQEIRDSICTASRHLLECMDGQGIETTRADSLLRFACGDPNLSWRRHEWDTLPGIQAAIEALGGQDSDASDALLRISDAARLGDDYGNGLLVMPIACSLFLERAAAMAPAADGPSMSGP